jgi:hypothetical protein
MRRPVGRIPKFIDAGTRKGLQRLMLKTQVQLGYGVEFFDIQFAEKKWVAWFCDNDDITLHNLEEKLGTDSVGNS